MGKEEAIEFISDYLQGFKSESLEEILYELIVVKGMDKTRLRNMLVIRDYDNMWKQQNQTATAIRDELAAMYDCSQENIRYILKNRRFNEI